MPTMYFASIFRGEIEPVEVQKVTLHRVTYERNGKINTSKKVKDYSAWFETKDTAKDWLLGYYRREIEAAKNRIERNESLIKKVNNQ